MSPVFGKRSVSTQRVIASVVAIAAAAVACGVVEHPHDVQAVDTSDDFGPLGGTASVPTAGTGPGSVGGGGGAGIAGSPVGGGASGGASAGAGAGTGTGGTGVAGTGGGAAGGSAATGGSPPVSGVTITLGGMNVPKEKAVAFIHIGHSNMAGQARSPSSSSAYHLRETHPRAFMYKAGDPPKLALEPTAGGPGAGPGVSLLKEAAAAAPDYYFISLGHGEPSAYCSQFLPGALFYDELIAAPKAIKGRVTFGGIFIYLGITERHGSAADVNGFPDCVNKLVTAIRNDVGEPNLPAVMNDYEVDSTGEFAVSGAVATAIMPQIAKCPSVISNFALVSADDIPMQDDHHFNLDGQKMWAQRALAKMKEKGWSFWAR